MTVLHQREGHRMAYEVEQAKIRCSVNDAATAVDLSCLETGPERAAGPG